MKFKSIIASLKELLVKAKGKKKKKTQLPLKSSKMPSYAPNPIPYSNLTSYLHSPM